MEFFERFANRYFRSIHEKEPASYLEMPFLAKWAGLKPKKRTYIYNVTVMIVQMEEERKSLASHIHNEEEKAICLAELAALVTRARERNEWFRKSTQPWQRLITLIVHLDQFIQCAESQKSQVQSWKPPIVEATTLPFLELRGNGVLYYQSGAVSKVTIYFEECGQFIIEYDWQNQAKNSDLRHLDSVEVKDKGFSWSTQSLEGGTQGEILITDAKNSNRKERIPLP